MSFTTDLRNTTISYIDKLSTCDLRIQELQGQKNVYADAYLGGLIAEEKQKRDAAAAEGRQAIRRITDAYKKEVTQRYTPDGTSLTDDAKLLSSGMKLSAGDLERLFDKHAGNMTMQRLISEYAQNHNVVISRVYHSEAEKHDAAEQLAKYANGALSDTWRAAFITSPEYYNKITPVCLKGE